MEHGFINQCDVIMWFHSCKCSVREDICVCDLFSQFVLIVKAIYAYFAVRYFFCKLLSSSFCSVKEWIVRVEDRDGCCSVKGTLYSQSCSCSACSEDYHLFALYINTMLFQVADKSDTVCDMSNKFSILIYDSIYSADDLCCR